MSATKYLYKIFNINDNDCYIISNVNNKILDISYPISMTS